MNNEEDIDKLWTGTWVVGTAMGAPVMLLGRTADLKSVVLNHFQNMKGIKLEVSFEYVNQLVAGRDGGLGRNAFALPVDSTLHIPPVYAVFSRLLFLDEMHEKDRDVYKKYVEGALQVIKEARASRVGIVLKA